jgi:hypothetical protein
LIHTVSILPVANVVCPRAKRASRLDTRLVTCRSVGLNEFMCVLALGLFSKWTPDMVLTSDQQSYTCTLNRTCCSSQSKLLLCFYNTFMLLWTILLRYCPRIFVCLRGKLWCTVHVAHCVILLLHHIGLLFYIILLGYLITNMVIICLYLVLYIV